MTPGKRINLNPLLATSTIIAVLISLFLFWQNKKATELLLIRTFEDCQKSKNTKTKNDVCTTEDGREFKKEKPVTQEGNSTNNKIEFANEFYSLEYTKNATVQDRVRGCLPFYLHKIRLKFYHITGLSPI